MNAQQATRNFHRLRGKRRSFRAIARRNYWHRLAVRLGATSKQFHGVLQAGCRAGKTAIIRYGGQYLNESGNPIWIPEGFIEVE